MRKDISRRDFLKLSSLTLGGLAFSPYDRGLRAAFIKDRKVTVPGEIEILTPQEVPGTVNPVRPWMLDMETGEVVSPVPETGTQIANIFKRWRNTSSPLVELYRNNQSVVRVRNNGGVGKELGYISSTGAAVDLESERAVSDFNWFDWGQRASGEQYVRLGENGTLQSYMDYTMTAPAPSNNGGKYPIDRDRHIGQVHFLRDEAGNNFRLPGDVKQMIDLMQLVNFMYARVVNDNIFQLPSGERFNQFHALKNRLISDIVLIPKNGDEQARITGAHYLQSIGMGTSDESLLTEIINMARNISEIDRVSIPSARLAVSVATALVSGEVALFNDGKSPERSSQLSTKITYLKQQIPESAVVPFDQEKAIEAAVANEWMRIPPTKPRAFEVVVQNYELNTTDGSAEMNKGFVRKVIFSRYDGDVVAHSDNSGSKHSQALLPNSGRYKNITPAELINQSLIKSASEDSIFLTQERDNGGIKTGQRVIELKEIDSADVRLFTVPGRTMQWGVHTTQSGTIPMSTSDTMASWVGSKTYHTIPYQDIIMENGGRYTSSIDGFFQKGWASDITQRWVEWKKSGLKEVTQMALLTPDEYLSRLTEGGMFQPQGTFLKNTLLGRYAQMDIGNANIDSLKTNNLISALGDMPLYQVKDGVGQQIDILAKGDIVTCDNTVIMVNDTPMIRLFEAGGTEYAIPIDFAQIQMIDNGTRDRVIETAKAWIPLALLLIPYGHGAANAGVKGLLKLLGK